MKIYPVLALAITGAVFNANAVELGTQIIEEVPATARAKRCLLDVDIMAGILMQHYTWSGRFFDLYYDNNDTEVYIKNICQEYVFDTYVKGTLSDGKLRIPAGQYVFHQDANPMQGLEEADLYLYAAYVDTDKEEVLPDLEAEYIEFDVDANGVITSGENRGAVYYSPEDSHLLAKSLNYRFAPFDAEAATVKLPQGGVVEAYDLSYAESKDGTRSVVRTEVVFDGDDIYIKGLTRNVQGWIKGTVRDGKAVFPSRQFVGLYSENDILDNFAVFCNGAEFTDKTSVWGPVYDTVEDLIFDFDPVTKTLVSAQPVTETIGDRNFYGVVIAPELKAAANMEYNPAVPANPVVTEFRRLGFIYRLRVNVPSHDIDGNPIDTDGLSYRIFFDDEPFVFSTSEYQWIEEDMTEIPYAYQDYDGLGSDIIKTGTDERTIIVYTDAPAKLGVESVYTVKGKTNVSDRYVFDVASQSGEIVSGVDRKSVV